MSSTTDEFDWSAIVQAACKAARVVARRNWELDQEDIYGEIITWAVANRTRLEGLSDAAIIYQMKRVGGSWAEKERRQRIIDSGQYIYTPEIVRRALEEWYYSESVRETMPTDREDPHSSSDGSSPAVVVWDLDAAMQRLSDQHVSAIERRYLLGESMTTAADRKGLSRAVERLTWTLNYGLMDQAREYYRGRQRAA